MNRGTNSPIGGFAPQRMVVMGAAMGGGAAANGTLPSNGQLTDASGLYPKGENQLASLTYNAATGLYYATFNEVVKHILYAAAIVVDSGASPTTALYALTSKITPASKRVDFRIYAPGGTLTDLGTSDMLIIRLECADTTAIG